MARITKEQIEEARYANLYQFLLDNYGDDFIRDGRDLRMADNHSVTVMHDRAIFTDWGKNKTGNGITFLEDYYGYSFQEAVKALLNGYATDVHDLVTNSSRSEKEEERTITLPQKWAGEPRNLYAYLMKRGIPKETIKAFLDAGLIYQDIYRNVVFLNYAKSCYEIRGTNTFVEPYRRVGLKRSDKFWYFMEGTNPGKVYITEAAIDAISLYELLDHEPAMYASMHGVGNQQIIDRIVESGKYEVILAVDNDVAGFECAMRNTNLEVIAPEHKDWNEDLQKKSLAG